MKTLKFILFIVVLSGFSFQYSNGNERVNQKNKFGVIKGKIIDMKTRSPLAGVNVSILNTQSGCISDNHGYFILEKLDVGNYILQFDYIGYKILNDLEVDISLQKG